MCFVHFPALCLVLCTLYFVLHPHLKVFAHEYADLTCLAEEGFVGQARNSHAEGDGQVESIEGGLVDDDVGMDLEQQSH